jgi:4-amino-4-deoxychorismate lyase
VTAVPRILVNGQPTRQVAALDRGLAYGDGVFRTLRIDAGAPCWWEEQLAKLAQDCARLGLDCPTRARWQADLAQLGLPTSGALRLTVTRGEGPRGYQVPRQQVPTRIASVWASEVNNPFVTSINARLCHLRLGHQPALAGVKHLNRLENVLARSEWQDVDIREGILLDQDDQVISGVSSNLFLWQQGELRTPRLDRCGVAGVTRARLMARAAAAGYDVEEASLTLEDLHAADEVMFTSSTILLWRVARLADRVWDKPVVSTALWELLHA